VVNEVYQAALLSQGLVHNTLGGVLPVHWYPVRVAIKSDGYAGVPQKILNQFRVNAGPWKQGGARVPEVVAANIAKPCALQQGLEVPVDEVQSVYRRADSAEHETAILPIRASSAWGEPSTSCSHRALEKECSVP
jgi:hypothetical protein